MLVEPDHFGKGFLEIQCDICGATINVTYSVSIEIEDTDVVDAPLIEVECPECDVAMVLDAVDEETGIEEIVCENNECGAQFAVEWSGWGLDINISLLVGSHEKKDFESADDRDVNEITGTSDPTYAFHEDDYEDDTPDDDDEDDDFDL